MKDRKWIKSRGIILLSGVIAVHSYRSAVTACRHVGTSEPNYVHKLQENPSYIYKYWKLRYLYELDV
jgi:hypothetical protein